MSAQHSYFTKLQMRLRHPTVHWLGKGKEPTKTEDPVQKSPILAALQTVMNFFLRWVFGF